MGTLTMAKWRKTNKAKRVDHQCSNHGGCSFCRNGRLNQANKEDQRIKQLLKDYKEGNHE